MIESLKYELNCLNSANLLEIIPNHLYNVFKQDLNDRILPTLLNEFDHLIQTIDANNSFKILSLCEKNEKTTRRESASGSVICADEPNQTSSSISSHLSENMLNNCKTLAIEISTRICDIFTRYDQDLSNYFYLFEQQQVLLSKQNANIRLMTRNELLIYQRAIFIQKLNTKYFEMMNLLFQSVFDFYQKLFHKEQDDDDEDNETQDQEEDEETKVDQGEDVDDLHRHILIEKFHRINRIL